MSIELKKTILNLEFFKDKILSNKFKSENRMNKKDFTRNRKLPFSKVLLTVVRKSVKSILKVLNQLIFPSGIGGIGGQVITITLGHWGGQVITITLCR
ncbi:hypothetical protein [Arcobacter sp.]|uniref:hypothetical protein n=1 Tax=Arcobacter sp. TaxID=1872629 RepID=UPI003C71A6A8